MNPLEKPPFDQPVARVANCCSCNLLAQEYKLRCEIDAIDREIHAILKAELTRAKAGKIPFQP